MFRRLAPAYLAVALTAGIIGCGSSGDTGPLASDSILSIITQATTNTIAAQSFTLSGSASGNASVDVTIVRGVGCSGTVVQGGNTSKFIWIGKTVYQHTAGMPANQWMRGASTTSSMQGLIALCMPGNLLGPLSGIGVNGATRSVTTYDGQPSLAITIPGTQQDPSRTGSIVVTNAQNPVLLDISEAGFGQFTFTGYGATKTIAPPAVSP